VSINLAIVDFEDDIYKPAKQQSDDSGVHMTDVPDTTTTKNAETSAAAAIRKLQGVLMSDLMTFGLLRSATKTVATHKTLFSGSRCSEARRAIS
jgi:hypothetical protein